MRVFQLMSGDVQATKPTATALQAARLMAEAGVGALPVLEDGRPVGIVTDRDIAIRCVARDMLPSNTPVGEIMTADPEGVDQLEELDAAIEIMKRKGIRRVLVFGDGYVKGVLSLDDLAAKAPREARATEVLEEVARAAREAGGAR